MINAIIQRLKREHKESNINIKQVINTPNNKYQVRRLLDAYMKLKAKKYMKASIWMHV